ncbi:MAG: DUF1415 domain-containing protein, partial [Bacteroidia bacterium]|nr:DUF1415 domain-containing protein [Bacteroidia bacterium]
MDFMAKCLFRTRNWLQNFVIGLRLCPFAKTPFDNNQIRYRVYPGSDSTKLLEFI